MIFYTDTKEKAEKAAEMMRKEEPDYADDVKIGKTCKESFGVWAREDLGEFVVHNETE